MNLRERYENTYVDLIRQFAEETSGANPEGVSALHLPFYGQGYELAPIKFAFIGEETRRWGRMIDFLADAAADPKSPGRRWESAIHTFEFTRRPWTNNFGRTFWDTILKLLAAFHGVSDWRTVKKRSHPEILRCFVWANCNSLEGFAVTARADGAQRADWEKFKAASRKFDHLRLVLESFSPDVVVVMNWDSAGHYYPEGWVWEPLGEHLDYTFNAETGSHVFRTAHPSWLSKRRLYVPTLERIALKWRSISKGVGTRSDPAPK